MDDELEELLEDDRCRFVDPTEPLSYAVQGVAPSSYRCARCDRRSIKLWCDGNTGLQYLMLYCISCLVKETGRNLDLYPQSYGICWYKGEWTYTPFGYIPAIPSPKNDTFWKWGHYPTDAWYWWQSLPLL